MVSTLDILGSNNNESFRNFLPMSNTISKEFEFDLKLLDPHPLRVTAKFSGSPETHGPIKQ